MTQIPDGMLSKQDVMRLLDVSEKTIERYMSSGRLASTPIKKAGGGRKMPVFEPAEVERFRREMAEQATKPTPAPTTKPADGSSVGLTRRDEQTLTLRGLLDAMAAPAGKPLMTLKEAAEWSGLGLHVIERAIRGENPEIVARPLGPRRALVIRAADLRAYIQRLYEPEG